MFGSLSKLGQQNHNLLLLTGAMALCWVIWLTRNDLLFNKCQSKIFFAGTPHGDILALVLGSIANCRMNIGCLSKMRAEI